MNTTGHYVGLSHEEIQALGCVSGEAFRLYVAVASFAYGSKVVAHPKWSDLAKRMGKNLSPNQGRELAKKLEKAGLIKRGEFGAQDRWRLILKERVINERRETQKGGGTPTNQGGTPPQKDTPPPTNTGGVNNKNKKEKKENLISKINMTETFQSKSGFKFSKEELKQIIAEDSYRAEQILLCIDDWDEIFQINDWLGEFRREGLKTEEIQRRLTEKLMKS